MLERNATLAQLEESVGGGLLVISLRLGLRGIVQKGAP